MSPSKIWVFKSHSVWYVVEQLDEQLANTFLPRAIPAGVMTKGAVGGRRRSHRIMPAASAWPWANFLRRTWRRGPHRAEAAHEKRNQDSLCLVVTAMIC